jgi:PAS domain S-box-containing protein
MQYFWALFAISIALLARWFADPRLGTQLPYGSMLVASIVVGWFVSRRAALIIVYLGGIAANFFLLPPRWSFESGPDKQSWGLVVFMFLGTVISLLGGVAKAQRSRAEASAETLRHAEAALREAHDGLEQRVRERTAELARTNEFLGASEQRFRVLVESVKGYAILMLDSTGAIAAWNAGAERLFGYTSEVIGESLDALIPRADVATLATRGRAERDARRKDGSAFPIELEVSRLDPGGEFVAIVHDISERRHLEAITEYKQRRADDLRRKTEALEADNRRMQDAARLQSQFLANMSHELRTPLNAIVGFAELMHGGAVGALEDQQREFVGDILTSSRHLLALINDVLDLAKVESGVLTIAPEEVEPTRVIDEVRYILRDLASRRKIQLDAQVADDLGSVVVDPAKLKQIVYNYVSNAIKFTPEGGRVTIRAMLVGDAFRVEVEDTGIGIAVEDLCHLFVAFRQLDGGTTKRYPGTGLGLALCKRLAEAHGGRVGVRSVRRVGSTFWVELPRRPFAAAARHAQQA